MRKFVPRSERKPLEKDIEREHRRHAKKAGYFVTKIEKTSTDGFPDRFYARDGRVVLIEWKKDDGDVSQIQEKRISELRSAGVEVYVVRDVKTANRILGIHSHGKSV
jgi:hypothetical protein